MLELVDVTKAYVSPNFKQTALDGVSLAFRDNEFAAVLGPSGSGKTTMLNIIGGLDHYDAGDLIIDGVSTKEYRDRDWDTYRNNRIGFVFQSYNLIPHQTVLANVELALTLSGVNPTERRQRAIAALQQVGLGDHIRKRPNQLSGGQMQRVAIARALINNPEILLADEPTGALDTQTSGQVMDLLSEIARDRLVIMVTHNPELADQYANRIINLRDGQVVADSNPFDPSLGLARPPGVVRRASMAFTTALSLSFSNLMTKKGRTFTTALAGSIGIIGIALILALANGIDNYISSIEEETLAMYPLTISAVGIDLSAFLEGPGGGGGGTGGRGDEGDSGGNNAASAVTDNDLGQVRERRVLSQIFTAGEQNDLAALKEYIETNRSAFDSYTNLIQYRYDVTPQVFLGDTATGVEQVNPDSVLAAFSSPQAAGFGGMLGVGFGPNSFTELLENPAMYEDLYQVKAGRWPQNYNELVLVLNSDGSITDLNLFSLGLLDRSELRNLVESFGRPGSPGAPGNLGTAGSAAGTTAGGNSDTGPSSAGRRRATFTYEQLLAANLKLLNPADWYTYDAEFDVWIDRSNDASFMAGLLANAVSLPVVGVVQPVEGATITPLSSGINYSPALVAHLMAQAAQQPIVQAQLAAPEVNVFTSRTFRAERDDPRAEFDFSRLIDVDDQLLQETFAIDTDALELPADAFDSFDIALPDFSQLLNLGQLNLQFPELDLAHLIDIDFNQVALPPPPELDFGGFAGTIAGMISVDPQRVAQAFAPVLTGFIPELATVTDPAQIPELLANYLASAEVQAQLAAAVAYLIPLDAIEAELAAQLNELIAQAMEEYLAAVAITMQSQLQTALTQSIGTALTQLQYEMGRQLEYQMRTIATNLERSLQDTLGQAETQISRQMQTALSDVFESIEEQLVFDPELLAQAFTISMDESDILDLMTTILNPETSSFEQNLNILGYADPAVPTAINLFPRDFAAKQQVIAMLDAYNEAMVEQGTPERAIVYTDLIGAIMGSVTDILNMVTVGLISFVAISLVVSSIMIGVITYVSVLERRKEIGILRAMGASKRNIKQVFNAETLIVGFVAGTLGVLITLILVVIGNAIVYRLQGIANIASLPVWAALALIAVSMFLTFISGLIPSSSAARKDPVAALRSE